MGSNRAKSGRACTLHRDHGSELTHNSAEPRVRRDGGGLAGMFTEYEKMLGTRRPADAVVIAAMVHVPLVPEPSAAADHNGNDRPVESGSHGKSP